MIVVSWAIVTPLIALAIIAALTLGAGALSAARRRRRDRAAVERLVEEWGRPRPAADRSGSPGFYHSRRPAGPRTLDDTTWSDLTMDAVFDFLDRTTSVLGSEVLYDRLRRQQGEVAELERFHATVERFRGDGNQAARLALQVEFSRLTERTPVLAWQLPLEPLPPLPTWVRWACPAVALSVGASCAAAILNPFLIGLVVPVVLISYVAKAVIDPRIAPWLAPFVSVGQLLEVARRVARIEPAAEPTTRRLLDHLPRLKPLTRIARWLGRDPSRTDLGALLAEYFNLFFCADGNVLLLAFDLVHRHREDLLRVAETLGYLDAALAVASVRDGDEGWLSPSFAGADEPAELWGIRHPLVQECVPNSMTFGPTDGTVLTGANMTGKSTFLRSVGVNVVLAQSIFTAFGTGYRAPLMAVRSCISPTDALLAGKSLYQREAETVVSITGQARRPGVLLCLFDELFRGTNSVDRISATAALCSHLVGRDAGGGEGQAARPARCLVLVATHDLELVSQLDGRFAPYYFGDRVDANGLAFDYRLRPGVASSRNAIALLGILGAPAAVVEEANRRAAMAAGGAAASPAREKAEG